ncbi:chain-length determining protein [Neiella marina]|uniref:Chain-length determining protein n=1 Tax=Neiella holothuriorum TaxID=2870530 RepID=A0ABS7EJE8_9GAMM|nr:GNVR domain-containing protein [Neiella holothuriorum]MBW8192482.1 chain-length determining protein [Neiella holothuriorum]
MNELLPRIYLWLDALWRRRYLLVMPTLVLPIIGLVVGMTAPKVYRAHTTLLIQETAKLNPFLEDLAVSANLDMRMNALTTLLHSRHMLTEVAIAQNLIDQNSTAGERDWVIQQLSDALTVTQIGPDVIRIEYRAENATSIEPVLQQVTQRFVENLLAPERSSIRESERFLATHLALSRDQLELAEMALAQFRSDNANGLPELHSANTERLSRLRQKLLERQAELSGAEQSLGSLDQQLSRTDPVLARLEEQIISRKAELVSFRARYTDDHSKIQALQRTIRQLQLERSNALSQRNDMKEADQQPTSAQAGLQLALSLQDSQDGLMMVQLEALQNAQQRVNGLREEVKQLQNLATALQEQVGSVGDQERQLLSLQRDLRVKRGLYEDLLQRYEMAKVTGALGKFEQSERIKIIDRPFTPGQPTNLPLWLFVIAGLMGGLGLGAGLVLLFELSDPTLRTINDIEALTGIAVITRIPPLTEH